MHCVVSQENVTEAFLAAPPLLSSQIFDMSLKFPLWLMDLYQVEEFPLGNGTQMQQLITRGQLPAIERGFDKWAQISNNTGCDPCEGPNCSYNWTQFGGLGIERKIMSLMTRDFRSPAYCVKEIQTTAHFQQIFAQIVQNLYRQIAFFKEYNIGFNYLTSLAKKYVVDSGGPKPNPENIYVYRNQGTGVILSALNIDLLEFFYEYMRRDPSVIPYDIVDGQPIFALEASQQLLSRLWRDDPQLRQDLRFSGFATDLVTKYNFVTSIRGMFFAAPILYPRRFRVNAAGGWDEVLPFINNIPMEIGSFSGFNPQYQDPSYATHEEILMHGKWPFKVMYLPTSSTLGENTSFGPEYSFMNAWQWVNPQTVEDPLRRVGQFVTSATIGLAPQWSEGIYGILVTRAAVGLTFQQSPLAVCPTDPEDCDNTVPDVLCPCPLIISQQVNGISGNVQLTVSVPFDPVPEADDTIQFGINTGGYLTGTVVEVSEDGTIVEVTFPDGTDLGVCDNFTTVFCNNTLGCSATVQAYEINCLDLTRLDLTLSNPIKADTAADVITLYLGNGTTVSATVVSVDMSTLKWVVDVGATNFCDQVGGIYRVCVPPATDATCPACDGPEYTQCET